MVLVAAALLVLLPFHAFLTVWAASGIGHYTLLRLWKEFLLALLVIGCLAVLLLRPGELRRAAAAARTHRFFTAVLLYLLLLGGSALAVWLSGTTTPKAAAYGWLVDSRYLVFFLIVWGLSRKNDYILRHWKRIVLIPAAVVIGFALLERAVLPPDFLRHFGYGPSTIPAIETVDEKAGYRRIQSTLRGANPFGAYLVVVVTMCLGLLWRDRRRRAAIAVFGAAGVIALLLTLSRSAWLGLAAAAAAGAWLVLRSVRARRLLVVAGACLLLIGLGAGYGLRDNDVFQNIVFHTDEHSRSAMSSNQGHFMAAGQGVRDIIAHPFGGGTGTAGPASVYGSSEPRIAENYFIQIGQETGVVGLALYLAITFMVARGLYARRGHTLGLVLLISLIGLTVVNMLSHAWTDDTLAYIWWGLAGAALALPVRRTADERS